MTQKEGLPYNAQVPGLGREAGEMRFNVGQLLKEPIGSTRRYAVEETFVPLDGGAEELLVGWVEFTRTDRGIWARGTLQIGVPCVCSRCLESYAQALPLEIDDQYYPLTDPHTGAPLPVSVLEEGGFSIDAQHTLDLREAVRQAVVSNLPMKPLCQPECRGICPECGASRNVSLCQCPEEPAGSSRRPLLAFLPTGVESLV